MQDRAGAKGPRVHEGETETEGPVSLGSLDGDPSLEGPSQGKMD